MKLSDEQLEIKTSQARKITKRIFKELDLALENYAELLDERHKRNKK